MINAVELFGMIRASQYDAESLAECTAEADAEGVTLWRWSGELWAAMVREYEWCEPVRSPFAERQPCFGFTHACPGKLGEWRVTGNEGC